MAGNTNKLPLWSGVIGWFPRALREVARTSAYGHRNRPNKNLDPGLFTWEGAFTEFTNSLCRHLVDEQIEGEVNNEDDDLYHAAQVAWNALARLETMLIQKEKEPPVKEAPVNNDTDVCNTDTSWEYVTYAVDHPKKKLPKSLIDNLYPSQSGN